MRRRRNLRVTATVAAVLWLPAQARLTLNFVEGSLDFPYEKGMTDSSALMSVLNACGSVRSQKKFCEKKKNSPRITHQKKTKRDLQQTTYSVEEV